MDVWCAFTDENKNVLPIKKHTTEVWVSPGFLLSPAPSGPRCNVAHSVSRPGRARWARGLQRERQVASAALREVRRTVGPVSCSTVEAACCPGPLGRRHPVSLRALLDQDRTSKGSYFLGAVSMQRAPLGPLNKVHAPSLGGLCCRPLTQARAGWILHSSRINSKECDPWILTC